jgi:hypothetical protein
MRVLFTRECPKIAGFAMHDFYDLTASCHDCWTVLYQSETGEKSFGSFFRAIGMAAYPLLMDRRDQKSVSQKITEVSNLIRSACPLLRVCVVGGLRFHFHRQLRDKLHTCWKHVERRQPVGHSGDR